MEKKDNNPNDSSAEQRFRTRLGRLRAQKWLREQAEGIFDDAKTASELVEHEIDHAEAAETVRGDDRGSFVVWTKYNHRTDSTTVTFAYVFDESDLVKVFLITLAPGNGTRLSPSDLQQAKELWEQMTNNQREEAKQLLREIEYRPPRGPWR